MSKKLVYLVSFVLLLSITSEGWPSSNPNPADGSNHPDTWVNLSWSGGDFADSYDVYFGDNFEDVTNGTGDTFQRNQAGTSFFFGFPNGLVRGTTYYWRIDDVEADGTKHKGKVWSFLVQPKKAYNPNPSDGGKFIDIDVTLNWAEGYGMMMQTVYLGNDYDAVSNATTGGTSVGGSTSFDPDLLEIETVYYWRVDTFGLSGQIKGDVWSFTTSPREAHLPSPVNGAVEVSPDVTLTWKAGANAASHDVYFGDDADTVAGADTTTTGVYRGRQVVDMTSFTPGSLDWDTDYYWRIDEVEADDTKHKGKVWNFKTLPLEAHSPSPANGAVDVPPDVTLTWKAGANAASHDVYFGDDAETVAKADTKTTGVYRGQWDLRLAGWLLPDADLGRDYYWRIDEVEADGTKHVGDVWSFTTADFIIVDDFEDYTDELGKRIFQTWRDGFGYGAPPPSPPPYYPGNGTGSTVGYRTIPFAEQTTVHGGGQSMPFGWDNTIDPFYSEAEREFLVPWDFTEKGVVSLSIWIYGDSNNTSISLYIGISDSNGTTAIVNHPDPTAAQIDTWTEWNIPLSEFSDEGVDLTSIKKMYIGTGNRLSPMPGSIGSIYFDDIKLYKGRCFPALVKPVGDLNNDCIVDFPDLEIIGDNWLVTESDPAVEFEVDLNADGTIDFKDYTVLANNWLVEVLWPE